MAAGAMAGNAMAADSVAACRCNVPPRRRSVGREVCLHEDDYTSCHGCRCYGWKCYGCRFRRCLQLLCSFHHALAAAATAKFSWLQVLWLQMPSLQLLWLQGHDRRRIFSCSRPIQHSATLFWRICVQIPDLHVAFLSQLYDVLARCYGWIVMAADSVVACR